MEPLPKIISVSEKIYRKLLCLYPQAHRRDYAGQMTQLFRDQCREAWRAKCSAGILKLWLRVLPDVAKTSVIEQFNERNQIMKSMNAKNIPLILLIIGLAFGLASFAFANSLNLLRLMVSASAVVILIKAVIEFSRPSNEWLRMAVGTFVLMFIYAVFMPAWAKMDQNVPEAFKWSVMGCLFLNPIVVAIKLLQFLIQRRKN